MEISFSVEKKMSETLGEVFTKIWKIKYHGWKEK